MASIDPNRLNRDRIQEALSYVHHHEREVGRAQAAREAIRHLSRQEADILLRSIHVSPSEVGRDRTRRRDPAIPSQAEYERREREMFHKQLREIEREPLADRKEACREFFEAMRDNPDLVGQRVGWLIDGSYGFGAYQAAQEVVRNTRMNRVAWLTQVTGALEWRCPPRMLVANWKKLSPSEKERLKNAVEREISSALAEGSNGRDPRRRRRRRSVRGRDPQYPSTPAGARAYKNRIEAMMRKYPGDGGGTARGRSSRRSRRR